MDQPERLSKDEARQLAEHLAALARTGLPLAPGLRAAAAEIPNPRLALAMTALAQELDAGRSLEDVLAAHPRLVPPHMQRLIETGVRSGNLPEVLVRLVDIDRTSADLSRNVRQAIAYPLMLLALLILVASFLAEMVVPGMAQVFRDFKTDLPLPTTLLLKVSSLHILPILGIVLAAASMLIFGLRMSLGPHGWQQLLGRIPLIGPTLLWRGVAQWSRLLALLLRQNIPLTEAAKLAAHGVSTPLMAVNSLRVAKMAESGRTLGDALAVIRSIPKSLVPLVRWGEEHGALPEALDSAAEMFETRVQLRAALLRSILPPITFILIALGTLSLLNAMFMPMTKLITDLSGGFSRRKNAPSVRELEINLLQMAAALGAVWMGITLLVFSGRSTIGAFFIQLAGVERNRFAGRVWSAFVEFCWIVYLLLTYLLLFLGMVALAGVIGFILWIATLVIALMIKIRYGDMERRSLLWAIAVAMEKNIPLPACARAFADDSHTTLGKRTRHMASLLENAVPLNLAIEEAGIRLPNDALVAVRTGSDTGGLAALLKSAARQATTIDAAVHGAVGRVMYLMAFIFFASFVVAFMMIKIIPAYMKIFQDFRINLPPITLAIIRFVNFVSAFGFVAGFFVIGLFAAMLYAVGRYTGVVRWDPPLLRRFALPLDGAVVLRSLAESVEQHRPLVATMESLARQYPKSYIRDQLQTAYRRLNQGADWCDSLHDTGLLSTAEAGVLKSADRVGNLVWALNDMADRLVRKFTARLTGVLSLGFPLVMLAFAAVVFLIAAGMIYPLAELIIRLA